MADTMDGKVAALEQRIAALEGKIADHDAKAVHDLVPVPLPPVETPALSPKVSVGKEAVND